jgi:hypothetical protein
MRVSINAEVQLAPAAARPDSMLLIQPLALAVYLEARACMGFSVSRVFCCHLPPFYLRQFLCSVGGPFLHPGLHRPRARCGAAVNIGRRSSPKAARSDIDGCERGATLDQVGLTVLSAHIFVSAAC